MRLNRGRLAPGQLLAAAVALAAPGIANAQANTLAPREAFRQPQLHGATLTYTASDDTPQSLDLGCVSRTVLAQPDALYVACQRGELLTIRVLGNRGAQITDRRHVNGDITAVFMRNGHVYLQIVRFETRALDESPDANVPDIEIAGQPAPMPPRAATCITPVPEADEPGEVVALTPGEAAIDLGSDDGIAVDDHIAFSWLSERREMTELIVARVVGVTAGRSRVQLGLNERVPLHATAEHTRLALTTRRVAPPRASGLFEFGLGAAFFFGPGQPAGGVLATAWVGYHFQLPFYVELGFIPVGGVVGIRSGAFGTAVSGVAGTAIGRALVALDLPWFALGVGVGGSTHIPDFGQPGGGGLAVIFAGRLGALDGLHIAAETAAAFIDARAVLASTRVSVRIPLSPVVWLEGRGGGGSAGYAFGELALRVLVRGNGDHGSVFLTPAIGGTGMFNTVDTAFGPSIGLTVDGRI